MPTTRRQSITQPQQTQTEGETGGPVPTTEHEQPTAPAAAETKPETKARRRKSESKSQSPTRRRKTAKEDAEGKKSVSRSPTRRRGKGRGRGKGVTKGEGEVAAKAEGEGGDKGQEGMAVEVEGEGGTKEGEAEDEAEGEGGGGTGEEGPVHVGEKREADGDSPSHEAGEEGVGQPPPAKRGRRGPRGARRQEEFTVYQEGTIERGHVYFFYRPKVMIEEAHSLDDVRNFHMVLVPTLPEFAAGAQSTKKLGEEEKGGEENKMEEDEPVLQILPPGADVVPSSELQPTEKKRYRHLIVGKKQLPTESLKHTRSTSAIGNRRGGVFWATVLRVGDDLYALEERMGEKTYETKTRGTRHEGAARLAARGLYAFVNTSPRVPSQRETHFVYRITHPPVQEFGEVQEALGIREAAAFVMQVKNPLAPATGPMQVRSAGGKKAEYPERLMKAVFGTGTGGKGRESYGLRFASCETPELLDCEGTELLFIAGREGQEGLEVSIGEERGEAMKEAEEKEGKNINVEDVLRELSIKISEGGIEVKPLKGEWI